MITGHKKEAQGQRDGSVGKGVCFLAWLLEFDSRTHMRKEKTNLSFDLHTCAHTYTRMLHTHKINKYTLKKQNKTKQTERRDPHLQVSLPTDSSHWP